MNPAMLLTWLTIATLALLLQMPIDCHSADSAPVSLMRRIQSSANLTRFAKLLKDTGLDATLDSSEACSAEGSASSCYIIFAPTNDAIARSAAAVSLVNQTLLAMQHVVTVNSSKKILLRSWAQLDHPAVVGRDIGFGRARIFSGSGSVLFWQAKLESGRWLYHANNAGVNDSLSNQEAANGVLHVLDDVALPLSRDLSLAALFNLSGEDSFVKQLHVGRTVKTFKDWMSRDPEFQQGYGALLAGGGVRSAFLPTDAAWSRLSQPALDLLNASDRRDILTAHLVPDVALFTAWLAPDHAAAFVAGTPVRGTPGRLVVRGRGGSGGGGSAAFVSVGGVFAGLVAEGSNLALRDATLHSVDRVLSAPPRFRGLSEAALAQAPGFHALCAASAACAAALAAADAAGGGGPWTLFAPADVSGLAAAIDLDSILLLHFVPSQLIPRCNMTDALLVSGANNSGLIRFRPSSDFTQLWVEGRLTGRGYVRSELVSWDEPTQSGGLLHTIRAPLGRPTVSLSELVAQLPQLSAAAARFQTCVQNLSANSRGNRSSSGGGVTAFVPDGPAMAELSRLLLLAKTRAGNNGTAAAEDGALDEVLCSFVLPDATILSDSPAEGSLATFPALAVGKYAGANATLVVHFRHGTTERVLGLQLRPHRLAANAPQSAGQYQCTDGLLYVMDSVQLDTAGSRDPKSQMFAEKSAAVSMATCSALTLLALATGAILWRRLLLS